MRPATRRFMVIASAVLLSLATQAQPENDLLKNDNKPYRILTSGKQVTIKSKKTIKNVMVWTSNGHRIVEQRDINAASFSFQPAVKEKVFFVMIQYEGLKPYTEKVGVQ